MVNREIEKMIRHVTFGYLISWWALVFVWCSAVDSFSAPCCSYIHVFVYIFVYLHDVSCGIVRRKRFRHCSTLMNMSLWSGSASVTETERLEALQKRAVRIIFNEAHGMLYILSLTLDDLQSPRFRRLQLRRDFFNNIIESSNCIHHLCFPERDRTYLSTTPL